jgi:hypothetical protein
MKQTIRSFPKTKLFITCLLLFSFFFIHQSCTKINTDVSVSPALTNAEITQKFFALPANAPFAVKRAAAEMKKRNDDNEYIVKFAKENGYPIWSKAIVSYNENAPATNFSGTSSNIAGAEDTTVILPLVPAGIQMVTGFVNATLSDSINLNLYRGGDYSRYTFENQPGTVINADKAVLQMMVLSKEVFGYTQFDVSDNRLFSNENQRDLSVHPYRVALKDTSGSQNLVNPCQQYIITVYSETCYSDGYCDLFPLYSFSIWLGNCGTETQTGGGSSGQGGGFPIGSGGTGSGPSGDIPPSGGGSGGGTSPYPCPTPQSRNIEALPCDGVPPPPVTPVPLPPIYLNETPCETAKRLARNADSILLKSKADSLLATIPTLATDSFERGFHIYSKFRVNPYDNTDTSIIGYKCGALCTGTGAAISCPVLTGYLTLYAAFMHTHPPTGYNAQSAKDVYTMIEERMQNNRFEASFVKAYNGNEYALTITDYNKAAAFDATKSQYLEGAKWKETSEIGKAFEMATRYFEQKLINDPNKDNLAYEMAMAAVLKEYNTGITLNKRDAAGNFQPIIVNTTIPNPAKPKKKVYTQDCL